MTQQYNGDIATWRPPLNTVPDKIFEVFHHDYDIRYIHDVIISKLILTRSSEIDRLRLELYRLNIAKDGYQTVIDRNKTLKKIKECESRLAELTNGDHVHKYIEKAKPYLEKYENLRPKSNAIVFTINGITDCRQDENRIERLMVIRDFTKLARKYMEIDLINADTQSDDTTCVGCGSDIKTVELDQHGIKRCPYCMVEQPGMMLAKSSKDGDRVTVSSESEDESDENFIKAFRRRQGLDHPVDKQDVDDVCRELDDYFMSHNVPVGDTIKTQPLDSKGRRGNTNLRMMLNALQQIGRSNYYGHAYYMCKVYWGWELPDYGQYFSTIMDHYHKTQKVFHSIPVSERKRVSSLGTAYRLYQHLRLVGLDCSEDEFKIAENPQSLREHEELWRKMCEGCDDPNIRYLP